MHNVMGIALILFLIFPLSAFGAVPVGEQAALRTFYTEFGGAGWLENTGWRGLVNPSEYLDPCDSRGQWIGIYSCSYDNSSVTGLSFQSDNNLTGTLVSSVAENILSGLPNLTTLFLAAQPRISGTIPEEMVCGPAAEKLLYLGLQANSLSGIMPGEFCLGNRSSSARLHYLNFQENSISGTIPKGFLCGNAAAVKMRYFIIKGNRVSGDLPDDTCLDERSAYSRLGYFDVGNNRISGTIPENFICGNPAAQRMMVFHARDNALSGTLPSDTCLNQRSAYSQLYRFDVKYNRISGTVPEAFFCGNRAAAWLVLIVLSDNILSGTLPSEDCLSSRNHYSHNLQIAQFDRNNISGTVPAGFVCGNTPANGMTLFSVQSNRLSGTLPTEECLASRSQWANLRQFVVSWNLRISGTIPSGFLCGNSAAETLQFLDLQGNMLSGTLPSNACLANRSASAMLQKLWVSENKLSGTLPEALVCGEAASERLDEIWFPRNGISGTLPSEHCLGNRSTNASLSSLFGYSTALSGTTPVSLLCGRSSPMKSVVLNNCRISGTIPSCPVGQTNLNLSVIDLQTNRLSGSLPDFTEWQGLRVLALSENEELEGSLLRLPRNIEYIVLEGAKVSGDVAMLREFPRLKKLYASGNYLSGTLPNDLFARTVSLEELSLSHNAISGGLPTSINHASQLRKLILNNNRINGRLPEQLGEALPNLTDVRLDLNEISCDLPPSLKMWPSPDSATIQVLQGNLFGCDGLQNLRDADDNGQSYVCGDRSFIVPAAALAIVGFTIVCMAIGLCTCANLDSVRNVLFGWWRETRHIRTDHRLSEPVRRAAKSIYLLTVTMVGLCLLIVVIGVPAYIYAETTVSCRFLGKASLAYIESPQAGDTISWAWAKRGTRWAVLLILGASLASIVRTVACSWSDRVGGRGRDSSHNINISLKPFKSFQPSRCPVDMNGENDSVQATRDSKTDLPSVRKESRSAAIDTGYTRLNDTDRCSCGAWMCKMITFAEISFLAVLLLVLVFTPSVGQVVVDLSTSIAHRWKALLFCCFAGAHVLLSSFILPEIVETIVKLVSRWDGVGQGRDNVAVGDKRLPNQSLIFLLNAMLHVLGNIVAPVLAEAFRDPSCLHELLVKPDENPSATLTTDVCIAYSASYSGSITLNGCLLYLSLESGAYTPQFRLRSTHCTSALLRIFTPFFITTLLSTLLLPVLHVAIPMIFADPPTWAHFHCMGKQRRLFGAHTHVMWPESTETMTLKPKKLAHVIEEIILWSYDQMFLCLGVMLTMGIAAPLIAATAAFATVVLALRNAYVLATARSLCRSHGSEGGSKLTNKFTDSTQHLHEIWS